MNLYVARHGQTIYNFHNKVCGITDLELVEQGVKQAYQLSEQLLNSNINLIISSPLKRAVATAQIISEQINASYIIDSRLTEQNYGIYEGALRNNPDFKNTKKNLSYRLPEGESVFQVVQRVYNFLDEVTFKYANLNVLIISHGGVCRVIKSYFEDMTTDEYNSYRLENCALEHFIIQ